MSAPLFIDPTCDDCRIPLVSDTVMPEMWTCPTCQKEFLDYDDVTHRELRKTVAELKARVAALDESIDAHAAQIRVEEPRHHPDARDLDDADLPELWQPKKRKYLVH
jgi:uncharacterized Zn finger protein (UPF0148 family)